MPDMLGNNAKNGCNSLLQFPPMKNPFQHFLLTVFVLLQCVAPLAHAHIGDVESEATIYSHELHRHAHPQALHVENQSGAIVSIPCALPLSDAVWNTPAMSAQSTAVFPCGQSAHVDFPPPAPSFRSGLNHWFGLWSQAP